MTKTNRMLSRLASIALLALAMAVVGSLPPSAPIAWAQSDKSAQASEATPVLDQARQLYDASKFDEAVAKLRDAISSGQVIGSDALKAKELLGRCLVKAGKRVDAREAFKSLLRQDQGYRLDAVTVPPDEMEVFNLALKDVTAEQIEAGQRVPASIGLFFGVGSGSNKQFADYVKDGGGKDKFFSKAEFGGSVRFPIKPRWSLDIELARYRATNSDTSRVFANGRPVEYEITAIPLIVSVYWSVLPRTRWRGNVFAGLGPLMAARASFSLPEAGGGVLTVSDEKQGFIAQGGLEGEYLFHSRFSVAGRVLARSATASGFYKNVNLALYKSNVFLSGRKVDFSGVGAFIALRGYSGYGGRHAGGPHAAARPATPARAWAPRASLTRARRRRYRPRPCALVLSRAPASGPGPS